jgi:hypothetical protein
MYIEILMCLILTYKWNSSLLLELRLIKSFLIFDLAFIYVFHVGSDVILLISRAQHVTSSLFFIVFSQGSYMHAFH